jgi:hypothetical protein
MTLYINIHTRFWRETEESPLGEFQPQWRPRAGIPKL